jgi:DNA-directed RNA polymerase subunit RPC12/RpoP
VNSPCQNDRIGCNIISMSERVFTKAAYFGIRYSGAPKTFGEIIGGEMEKGDTYTCAQCGGEFETEWDDDEPIVEAKKNFPGVDMKDMVVICDDCYTKNMARIRQ